MTPIADSLAVFSTLSQLNNEGVVRVLEARVHDGNLLVAMDFLRGATLGDVLAQSRLPEPEAVRILLQLTAALEFLHANGLVHGAVNAENLFIQTRGQATLIGFGSESRVSPENGASPLRDHPDRAASIRLDIDGVLNLAEQLLATPRLPGPYESVAAIRSDLLSGGHRIVDEDEWPQRWKAVMEEFVIELAAAKSQRELKCPAPRQMGAYTATSLISSGERGGVYRATAASSGKAVALKVMFAPERAATAPVSTESDFSTPDADALSILHLAPGASEAEITSAYDKLWTEYQIRLGNAWNASMRSAAEQALRQITDAKECLLPGRPIQR